MRGSHTPLVWITAVVSLSIALGGTALGQSPSAPAAPALPSAISGASSTPSSPEPTAVGPIRWRIGKDQKDFGTYPSVYSVGQLPDGRLIVTGSTGKDPTKVTGAVWVSADGSKWKRVKGLKAPLGSAVTKVRAIGPALVATGTAADGTGLTWTSSDGDTWSAATPMAGAIYDMIPAADGLRGIGVDGAAAATWFTADGLTWQETPLASSGRALHIVEAPDGTLVATGAVTDDAGVSTPVVWHLVDGAAWAQATLAGLLPGRWSIPAAAVTPAGIVATFSESGQSGSIGHVWTSPDGLAWTEAYVDQGGALTAAGSAGTDALLIGHGQVLRSPDGITWTPTRSKAFDGYIIRDVMTLTDGRSFAAGDYYSPTGGGMATWIGVAEPAS